MKKSLREWAADLFLVGMGILFFALVAELLWATFTSERKARLADDAQRETQEFARKVQDVVAPSVS